MGAAADSAKQGATSKVAAHHRPGKSHPLGG